MQQTLSQPGSAAAAPLRLNLEVIAYTVLIALTLALRLIALGDVPISTVEVTPAVSAWRTVMPQSPVVPEVLPDSPAVFWAQRTAFTVLGANEMSARVLTALAGVLVVLTPLLFRDLLGATRSLLLAALLMASAVLMIASRTSEGLTWGVLFAAIMLWGIKCWWQTRVIRYGAVGVAAGVLLVLFSDPAAVLLALLLLVAGFAAARLTAREEDTGRSLRAELAGFPLLRGLGLGVLVLVVLATGFLTFVPGLSSVGSMLGGLFMEDFEIPLAHALLVTLFYEPLLPVLAVAGLILLARRHAFTFVDRFFTVWLIGGVILSIVYGRLSPASALWVTLPLAGLASYAVAMTFYRARIPFVTPETLDDADAGHLYSASWGKWIVALTFAAFLVMLAVHLGVVARASLQVGAGLDVFMATLAQNPVIDVSRSLLWTAVTVLMMIVGYFLAAGVWGAATTLQGAGLGLFGYLLAIGISAGWYGSVANATVAAEGWHPTATTETYPYVRASLLELAQRQTQGEPLLPVTVVRNPAVGITGDRLIAWALRDFPRVEFVPDISAARGREIIITALDIGALGMDLDAPPPDLGGNYAGQHFTIKRVWDTNSMTLLDFPAWLLQRRTRAAAQDAQAVILWVRADVFHNQTQLR